MKLLDRYQNVRRRSIEICNPLQTEDYVVQPVADVSPPKWHLGHTTWFFETFLLKQYLTAYQEYDPNYNFVFNSYYETVGARVIRTDRGNLSRPTVEEVYHYREHVDIGMASLLANDISKEAMERVILGLNHEQQHQELLCTDIKYILGHNPLFPHYSPVSNALDQDDDEPYFIRISEGIYEIGHQGDEFCFDNELGRHRVFLDDYEISGTLVTNADYLEFINAGAYHDFKYWHADGWEWVKLNQAEAPLYWYLLDGKWCSYQFSGLEPINLEEPVCHVSFYEAAAYAAWKGLRLPTEQEWEVAANHFKWGKRWEWTNSAYLPYPGFKREEGAIGEYNGKFMINQMVLRGASEVTSPGHSRHTYRNFFQPQHRWQFTGIRLAKSIDL
ncbi:MAG: ergothioneine biosynthesis protein EgtB [Sphingobacteriaceae bacterium]